MAPTIVWIRRDLRLADHEALAAALTQGGPVIPVFLLDEVFDSLGAAPRFRLGLALKAFADALAAAGSRLILRRGPALPALQALAAETGARAIYWQRLYDPQTRERDTAVKAGLTQAGLEAKSFPGFLLFEPMGVLTGAGGPYRVYSPYWRAVSGRPVLPLRPAPAHLPAPEHWPTGDRQEDWQLDHAMNRGATVLASRAQVGEAAAQARLEQFVTERIHRYRDDRDFFAREANSGLSEALTWGEISPARAWHAGREAEAKGAAGAEHFLKELTWREFAHHLAFHTPHLLTDNWRPDWDGFGWSQDATDPGFIAWTQGRTGVRLVDAAMRELYVTGRMHNRARMIAASYLTKHLLMHWRLGMDWFADCLTDWDPASNAMGWQWVAGSGPDAAPYFRVFNPDGQADKFDPDGSYRVRWLAEGNPEPGADALAYFDAVPRSWGLSPKDAPPVPAEDLATGRARALAAYAARQGS